MHLIRHPGFIRIVGKTSDALVYIADWISCRGTHHSGCDDVHLPSGRRFPPAYRAVNHDPCDLHVTLACACSVSVVVQLDAPAGSSMEGRVWKDATPRTNPTFDRVEAVLMQVNRLRGNKVDVIAGGDDYVNTQPIDRGSTSCSTSAQDCGSAHLAYHIALCARDIHE